MVNKLIIIGLLVITPLLLLAQSFNIEWQECFGGSEWDCAYDILPVSGGYIIAGWTVSSDGDISNNNGLSDGWILKISTTGEIIWEKNYGGTKGDNIYRIFPAGQGEFYLLGASNSSDVDISYDPYPDSWDLWLLKIDSIGNIIWEEIYGGNGDETVWTGTTTDDGGIVALVWTSSSDGDVSNHYGYYDAWMIKVNSDGEKQWDITLGSPGQDVGQAIIQTSDGGFLVGISAQLFEGGNITCTPHNSDYSEAILVKLDADRNIEWDRCYGGSDHDGVTALAEVSDGYLMGAYTGSNDGDVSGFHGDVDIWIVKTDFEGIIIWQKCFGGSKCEDVKTMHIDEFENILIVGTTRSTDGDISHNHSISEYYDDIWLLKINSQGDLLREQCFGGRSNEELWFGFHYINENNYVIAGETNYGPSYDVACTPHGGNVQDKDIWVFEIQDTLTSVVESYEIIGEIKVYPNPAGDYVCFEVAGGGQVEMPEVKIFNILGMPVQDPMLYKSEGKIIWDVRGVAKGVYFYQITNNGYYSRQGKVVVN